MSTQLSEIPAEIYDDVALLFDFNQMHHELRPCSIGIGLGSHDPNVPIHAADLYHRGMFPLIAFTGANAPTTVERFPRGEAIHFSEMAIKRGVPADAILLETRAQNTVENVTLTRELLSHRRIEVQSAVVISRPYQQRRAYSTFRALWPDLDVICSSRPLALPDYVATIGDARFVVDMIVGDTQRVIDNARPSPVENSAPESVTVAFQRLVRAGFTSRLTHASPAARSAHRSHSSAPIRGIDR